jgi:predicted component of type VI protein secretion system
MARLVIYSSGARNQTVELTGRNVRIGRARENDVVLADATQVVSRFHAELRYEDGRYILLDLNSANGTWVWDHRIQRIVLDSGTVAEIGSYRLALETDTEATTVPPASRRPGPPRPPAPRMPASGTLAVSPSPDSPAQSPPPTRVPVPPPRVEPPAVPAVLTAPPRVSAPAAVADDSVSTAARVVIQPAAEASTTGVDRGGRSGGFAWPAKRLTLAGIALLGFALVAVGFAVGGRFLTNGRDDDGTRSSPAPAATAPAEPQVVPGPPAVPPVVPAATSAEKQEVVAPAVSAPPPVAAPLKTLGDDAFKRARTFDALGRTDDAIAQYERAVQLLAPDDPNRKTAKQRLDVLRAGNIK